VVATAFVNGTVLDGLAPAPRSGITVLIEDGTIVDLGTDIAPSDARRFDLEGSVLMPGLVDAHAHFALWALDLAAHPDASIALLSARTYAALAAATRAGVVAVRDLGGLERGFRDAVDAKLAVGPLLQTSVTIISPTNGIIDTTTRHGTGPARLPGIPAATCDTRDEGRAAVRSLVRAGANVIKVASTGGVSSTARGPTDRLLSDVELAAIVDEAHAWGLPVACHAIGGPGLLQAVRAGVDSIEHGAWLDETAAREMADRGTWYVPTLSAYELHLERGSAVQREHAAAIVPAHRSSVTLARAAGVRIAFGSDGGPYGYDPVLELEALVSAGVSPADAIAMATSSAAACLGLEDELGSIAPGRRADCILVAGNPLDDVSILRDPTRIRVLRAGAFLGKTRDAWT
jgi:imidazolonepropionase-like amidohydrolase